MSSRAPILLADSTLLAACTVVRVQDASEQSADQCGCLNSSLQMSNDNLRILQVRCTLASLSMYLLLPDS
jgi:hypothetical protein